MIVAEHPGSSIAEIVSRTEFPQSHVSSAVARLRELGVLQAMVDSGDARRTLVELTPGMRRRFAARTAVPVDGALAAALAGSGSAKPGVQDLEQVYDALTVLAQRLIPRALGRVGTEFEPLASSEAG
jgi:DNA-binding MarR family transcriptional regulator